MYLQFSLLISTVSVLPFPLFTLLGLIGAPVITGAAGGALKGATLGAIGGAIAGDPRKGAKMGAAMGGAGGAMGGLGARRRQRLGR